MASYEEIVNHLLGNKENLSSEYTTQPKLGQALEDQIKEKYALTTDKIGDDSVFDDIQAKIDLDSNNLEEDLKKLMTQTDSKWSGVKDIWNESVKSTIRYMLDKFLSEEADITINGRKVFSIADIRRANAGLSFEGKEWVKPVKNVDGDEYQKVRGTDKIEKVLNNHDHMQFTRTQNQDDVAAETTNSITKYIRLLMPQYTRRVEVEDLNRNFWVIGQVMAAISAYLFDEDSPITNMFKRLISEINQLWENILYLWVNQNRPITKVHCEVLYLPNSSRQKKYDNFNTMPTVSKNEIEKRIKFLIDQYSDSNLIILPIIRYRNYKHNYYKNEIYRGIWFYDRNSNNLYSQVLKAPTSATNAIYGSYETDSGGYFEITTTEENASYITGIYEGQENYKYYYPLIKSRGEVENYIGGLRTNALLNGSYSYNSNLESYCFYVNLEITAQDLGGSLNLSKNTYKESYRWSTGSIVPTTEGINFVNFTTTGTKAATTEMGTIGINKGFYFGEMPSMPARHINTAGLQLNYIFPRPFKDSIREIASNIIAIDNMKAKANQIISKQASSSFYIPTLRVGHYRIDGAVRKDNGSSGYFDWVDTNTGILYRHEYTSDSFGNESVFTINSEGLLPLVKMVDETNPAMNFNGSFFIGSKLYLPDFEAPLEISYENYQFWGCTTPNINNNGIDDLDGTEDAVELLARNKGETKGRIYDIYYIAEFFKKDKDEDYGPHNWAIRLTQISTVYGALYSTDAQQKFWMHNNPSSRKSEYIKKTFYKGDGATNPSEEKALVTRVAVHCFSIDNNNNPIYCRREYNSLVVNSNKKIVWIPSLVEWTDAYLGPGSADLKKLAEDKAPTSYQKLNLTKSNIPNYSSIKNYCDFINHPVKGY